MLNSAVGSRRFVSLYIVIVALIACASFYPPTVIAQSPLPSPQIAGQIDDTQLVVLRGQTHPLARPQYDLGRVSPTKVMSDLILVLRRPADLQAAFDAFVDSQYDQSSPNYHVWLTPEEVGDRFGVAQSDIDAISTWLGGHQLSITEVPKDRMTIRFSGTVQQVESTFHIQIHNLNVKGENHIANMTDPQIPAAVAPVVVAIKSLHNFFPHTLHRLGNRVKLNREIGKWQPANGGPASYRPAEGAVASGRAQAETVRTETANTLYNGLNEDISPWDFATIYNVLPLWSQATPINGTGQTIYIAGRSNIYSSDITNFQNTFGLPYNPPTVIITNFNPGYGSDDDLAENTSDVEMAGAIAKEAKIVLVTSASTGTSDGAFLSAQYIVNHGALLPSTPAIMSFSYGECESNMISDGSNTLYSNLWQTAASEGIAAFVAAGDEGSAACDGGATEPNSTSWDVATQGLMVSGVASTPYDTAVGGTDLFWSSPSTYWNTNNNSITEANAKGYIPEQPWNDTCAGPMGLYDLQYWASFLTGKGYTASSPTNAESACNFVYTWASTLYNNFWYTQSGVAVNIFPFVGVWGGGGGKSNCTWKETTGNGQLCAGGYAKPAWQANVTGIPNDSARDLPDISFFSGGGMTSGSAYLICVSTSQGACYEYDIATFSEIGGTSLSSPAMAGVMALINQKMGKPQGNPNAELYKLASQHGYSGCSAESITTSSSCLFNDIDEGTNAMPCNPTVSPQCNRSSSSDAFGILSGFSATVGYDLATGLGSLNVANVVNAWQPTLLTPTVKVTPASSSITTTQSLAVTVVVGGGSGNPTPTGSVTLTSGSYTSPATTLSSGSATITIPAGSLATGTDTLTATYKPDSNSSSVYNGATGTASVTVTTAALTPTATSETVAPTTIPVGYPGVIAVSATVKPTSGSGTPTGTVTFFNGTTQIGQVTLSAGQGGFNYGAGALTVGTYPITAFYSGDSNYSSSSAAPVTLTVLSKVTPTVTVKPSSSSITPAQSLSVVVTVGLGSSNAILRMGVRPHAVRPNGVCLPQPGTPTGSVTLISGTYSSGAQTLNCYDQVTISIPAGALATGTDTLTANYTPDNSSSGMYNSATGTATVTVTSPGLTPTTTTETITGTPSSTQANVGSSVTCSAKVSYPAGSPVPTGTMTFANGSTTLWSGALNSSGASSWSISSLAVGSYSIIASYSGDANYAASTSAVATFNVVDFKVVANPATVTVTAPGQKGQTTLAITPLDGFSETLNYTCSDLPAESTCTFAAASATSETLNIQTTAASSAQLNRDPSGRNSGWFFAMLLPSFLGITLLGGTRKKTSMGWLVLALALMLTVLWLPACGGASSTSSGGGGHTNSGTPAGTSTVIVTAATSGTGALSHQVQVALTVQ